MASIRKKQPRWFTLNRLSNITERDIQFILDSADCGRIAQCQHLYHELDKVFPMYFMLKNRRLSAISSRGFSGDQFFTKSYKNEIAELVGFLGSYVFYGIAVAKPIFIDGVWMATKFYDSRELRIDFNTGKIYSLASPQDITGTEIDIQRTCVVLSDTAICQHIAQIFPRWSVVQDKFCDYLDRFGIPGISVTMPTGGKKDEYLSTANSAQEGENTVWPNGTSVLFAPVDKNASPFIEALKYFEESVVTLCTGGLLTTLAEATGMGSGVSDAHAETWSEIVNGDLFKIEKEIRRVFHEIVNVDKDNNLMPQEAIDQLGGLSQLGYSVDDKQVSEATGWDVKKQ